MLKNEKELQEKVVTGGGETGTSQGCEPTNVRATLPNSKNQGDAMQKIEDPNNPGVEDTSTENNTKPTGDNSAKNKASVSMKEDIDAMFAGEEISEDFRLKATTIFEAAVAARVSETEKQLEEQYDQKLAQEMSSFVEEVDARIEEYMDYVVQEWMTENEVAIDNSLRLEIAEEFIEGMKKLFAENYIDIPEDKMDVLGELASKVEELEAKLNEAVDNNIQMKKLVEEYSKESIFAEVSEGLAETQVEKFAALADGVDYTDEQSYKRKLEIVKENYFADKKVGAALVEQEVASAEEPAESTTLKITDPVVARYMDAITRTVKK